MTIKNASLLAFVGACLATALLVWNFIFDLANVLRDVVAPVKLFPTLIYAIAWFTMAVFFFVFHRTQG